MEDVQRATAGTVDPCRWDALVPPMTDAVDVAALTEELRWVGGGATAARVRAGELTPREVVAAALARIDQAEPVLNAFIRVRHEEALAEADAVAERLAAGEYLPLAGVPIAVKDEVPMEGVVVTKGSRGYTKPSTVDADVIKLVRAAGAVIVGATRTPELCLVCFTESELGGVTRNPWDPTRTPGGSSGGSAAAVAGGLVPLALGADGGGSIRIPAAWCGLPGLYATPGAVADAPMGATWTGFVSHGGFGRSIADTALLADVLFKEQRGFAAAIKEPPAPLRIATSLDRAINQPIPQGGKVDAPWSRAMDLTATLLSELGHTIGEAKLDFGQSANKFTVRYLVSAREDVAALDDPTAIEPVARTAARMGKLVRRLMPWAMNTAPELAKLERSLEGFDLLLTPAAPCSAPPVGEWHGKSGLLTILAASRRVSFLNQWNLHGWPGISIPAGVDADGRPVAVLLTGRPGSEDLLLKVAAQVEAVRPWELGRAVA